MTRLLVSVRDADEAAAALAAGVDWIDIKEPRHGSLGRADWPTMTAAVERVAGRAPVSAALGELRDWSAGEARWLPPGVGYVKLGLAGCAGNGRWEARWTAALRELPASIRPVAVVYADAHDAVAPDWPRVVELAGQLGCAAVLVDTWRKDRGGLLDCWSLDSLADFIDAVQCQNLLAVVAGGLTPRGIADVLPCRPDLIAVRGAACDRDRQGRLDPRRVERLVELVRADHPARRSRFEDGKGFAKRVGERVTRFSPRQNS